MIFFLFPKIKTVLKGTLFPDTESIIKALTMEFRKILQDAFQDCSEFWKQMMHKCVRLGEDYLEETRL